MYFKVVLAVLVTISLLSSCNSEKKEVNRGFYFWKNNSHSISDLEEQLLDTLNVKKLYIKLFEVSYDDQLGPIPYAKSSLRYYRNKGNYKPVPTIYIQNKVFLKADKPQLTTFADNVIYLIDKKMEELGTWKELLQNEIQIDCDWTESSKDNYFYFLRELKKRTNDKISCTLRLYPYKFNDIMGTPPVDRAILMCYNLLNPKNAPNTNSILDLEELKKYITPSKTYGLPLDIALPCYSWGLCYNNHQYKGKLDLSNISISSIYQPIDEHWGLVVKDTVIQDIYLRKGDKIKVEQIDNSLLKNASELIIENVNYSDESTVAFFQLDYNNENFDDIETFTSVYNIYSH